MKRQQGLEIVALSGPVCGGKTTLAQAMRGHLGYTIVRTRHWLEERLVSGAPAKRSHRFALQNLGNKLDGETRGAWIAEAVVARLHGRETRVVVDAVRTDDQLAALRTIGHVTHIHVTASDKDLRTRYAAMSEQEPATEFESYEDVREDQTESFVQRLKDSADVVVDTSEGSSADELVRTLTSRLVGQ